MRKNRNSSLSLLLSLALLAAIAGCSKKQEAPQPPTHPAAPQAKPQGAPVQAVQKQLSSARPLATDLDFHRRTDPFKPPVAVAPAPAQGKAGETPAPLPAADLLPIQGFEVTKFKVAGIVAGLNQNRALVIDPNGKGYVVQAGMPIGNKNGRISRITANAVEVTEAYRDEKGKARKRTIVLTLAKKK